MARQASSILAAVLLVLPAAASQGDALAISQNIQTRHLPYGTILDPVFASPESAEITGYSRCGDSAIWTGHYLAAEAFRFQVTGSGEALENSRRAVAGIRSLVDVTGVDVPARCAVPMDSPYAPAIAAEEQHNGVFSGSLNQTAWLWVGNTSRDQYLGVFFGLAAAYDMVDDAGMRGEIRSLITRLLDRLLSKGWLVVMPGGAVSTTFAGRPDQQLALLAIGRHVNSGRFGWRYSWDRFFLAQGVILPVSLEVLDAHNSYFKFNLDYLSFYHLIRLETNSYYRSVYRRAYDVLRRTTDDHGNAHFNMIDRALKGPDERRDRETARLLEEWLLRPRRDGYVDLRGKYPSCGEDRACEPVPVPERVRTDFLWQRSPFLLYGGGEGRIESAGIDYILPYWMARFYQVLSE
jgi:hypothetical protein